MMKCENDERINIFCGQFLNKIFYYALKKTSSRQEAEDLSAEISLEVIKALLMGSDPKNFHAWVWKVARNRYSRWAIKNHIKIESVSGEDIDLYDDIPDAETPENKCILSEQLYLLRRELSLIAKEYRDIVVAFYIEDKKIGEIAKELGLPVGTVKTKLFKCRKILKEGMDMAREFGTKSYKPEDIRFIMSGQDGKDGSPWSLIERKIPQNILLSAYDKPMTVDELSLELGVAAPYMEQEAEILAQATLLKKEDNKYATDIAILSKDAQSKNHDKHKEIMQKLCPLAVEAIKKAGEAIEKDGSKPFGGYQSFDDLKWLLLLRLADRIEWDVEEKHGIDIKGYTKRPNEGNWDLMGYEGFNNNAYPFVGLHGGHCKDVNIVNYKINAYNLKERAGEIYEDDARTIKKVALGNSEDCNAEMLKKLADHGFIRVKDGKYIPNLAVAHKSGMLNECLSDEAYKEMILPIMDRILELFDEYFIFTMNIVKEDIPKRLHNQINFCMSTIPSETRGSFVDYGLKNNFLKMPDNIEKSTIGMCLII